MNQHPVKKQASLIIFGLLLAGVSAGNLRQPNRCYNDCEKSVKEVCFDRPVVGGGNDCFDQNVVVVVAPIQTNDDSGRVSSGLGEIDNAQDAVEYRSRREHCSEERSERSEDCDDHKKVKKCWRNKCDKKHREQKCSDQRKSKRSDCSEEESNNHCEEENSEEHKCDQRQGKWKNIGRFGKKWGRRDERRSKWFSKKFRCDKEDSNKTDCEEWKPKCEESTKEHKKERSCSRKSKRSMSRKDECKESKKSNKSCSRKSKHSEKKSKHEGVSKRIELKSRVSVRVDVKSKREGMSGSKHC